MTIAEKRNLWLKSYEEGKDVTEKRISDGIEQNRKGDFKIRFIDKEGNPLKNTEVKFNQKSHEFKFGAHIFMLDEFETEEDNKKFREIFKEYFNLATVPFYWNALEPNEGKPRFKKDSKKIYRRPSPDLCLEYCEENGIDAKLHCLVYDKFIPDWLPKADMAEMERLYEKRIKEIAERYKGKMVEFEVINETLIEAWWKNQSVIMNKRDLVEWAFALARKYLPDETLVINDGGQAESIYRHDFRSPYFMQIEKCLMNGATIDKIGMQHHLFVGATAKNDEEYEKSIKDPQYLIQADPKVNFVFLDTMADLGLPIEFTEVTIPTLGDTLEDEEIQAQLLKNLYSVWFSHPAVNTIVYWNQFDGYCYNAGPNATWNENNCRGGLFHHDLTPKKSALMLKKLLTEEWHTEGTLTTDENGNIEFRGFFGDYEFDVFDEKIIATFGKNGKNDINLISAANNEV